MSVLMTLSDLERRDARGHIFRRIYLITFDRLIWQQNTCVDGHISMVSGTPSLQGEGGASVLSNFGGSLLFPRTYL